MNVRRLLRQFNDRVAYPWQAKDLAIETKGLTIQMIEEGFYPVGAADPLRSTGHGLDSNVIMAPVMWIMRTFTEAHAVVARRTGQVWDTVKDHPLELLIEKPNDGYNGDALWKGTCLSYVLDGNAYWRKIRNMIGEVIALWYVPHWLMAPKWPDNGLQFISHYEQQTGTGPPIKLLPRDVVHFRFGLDPGNPRLGFSPLRPLIREVFTDDEASRFSSRMLTNMGVPGLVVSPKDASFRPTDQDIEKMKTGFTGENRGSTVVTKGPTDVHQFGYNPAGLELGNLRDVVEERVCAILGLPSAVVGFGSGLQSTKVGATMRELVRLAWVQCLIPMQNSMGRALDDQLLPDFQSQTQRFWVRFDDSDVPAFQEERDLRSQRIARMVQAGYLRLDRAQEMEGLEVDDTQKVYLRPSNSVPIDENGDPIQAATPNGSAAGASADPTSNQDIPAAVLARRNGNNGSTPDQEG